MSYSALYLYSPLMLLDNAIGYRETKAFTVCFCGKKRLKYFLLDLLIDGLASGNLLGSHKTGVSSYRRSLSIIAAVFVASEIV